MNGDPSQIDLLIKVCLWYIKKLLAHLDEISVIVWSFRCSKTSTGIKDC